MTADGLGDLVNMLLMAAAGLFVWLLGMRKIGRAPGENPEADAWHERYGSYYRIGGMCLMVFAVAAILIDALLKE